MPLKPIVFSLLLTILALAPEQTIAQSDDEQTLRYLKEVAWPKAYKTQDTELLGQILAEEFQMIRADGEWSNKAKELDYIEHNEPAYDSLTFVITRLDVFENGTAIVAGTGIIRGRNADGPYVTEYQSSNVLIKREGRWQAIASHVSGVKQKSGV